LNKRPKSYRLALLAFAALQLLLAYIMLT